ncbi:MAG: ATP-dependent DNA helicase RecG [Phycisphaerae bacterium]|nr:ATP-dependent DNA helicase RecG [Phycisphaerae bacterium]
MREYNILSPDVQQTTDDLRYLKGVGPKRVELFAKLGVFSIEDLLEYYPRTHEFRPPLFLIKEIKPDFNVTIGVIVDQVRYNARSRPPRFEAIVRDATGFTRLLWFHGKYLVDKIVPGMKLAAWGKVSHYKNALQIVNPRWSIVTDIDYFMNQQDFGIPVYPATAELTSQAIAKIINTSFDKMIATVKERFDDKFLKSHQLISRRNALTQYHKPADKPQILAARRRLAFDELFLMELGLALRKQNIKIEANAISMSVNERLDKRIRAVFPFELTDDQKNAIAEICADMNNTQPMSRLVQGDVGAGKTVVALYAALLAVSHHQQVAIMAPTEILAEQHFLSIEKFLAHSRVKRILLKGGLTGKKRTETLAKIANGDYDIIVGTQALLQKDIRFNDLALVVIDEQHKFGVLQRHTIANKDKAPHYLIMTATPIPRTLAMTIFGDLDISTIKHLPPGRKPIKTRLVQPDQINLAMNFIREQITKGSQAYFVYPRVQADPEQELAEITDADEQPATIIKAAIAEHQRLQKNVFPEFNVALLHGQMNHVDKKQTMDDFRNHKIDILVSTVVIEVGVDVPNATIMVIENADRFGLAQLHQLRGRIGRGSKQSFCLLFGESKTPQAQQRLDVMVKTCDGFKIAEEDLKIRGPGEFFGTAQHGLPELKVASLIDDYELLLLARKDAFQMATDDPQLKNRENQPIREALIRKFGSNLVLANIG